MRRCIDDAETANPRPAHGARMVVARRPTARRVDRRTAAMMSHESRARDARRMTTIDELVQELGLVLPEAFRSPTGAAYPFSWVRVRGNRAFISGHLPLQPDGTLAEPRGKVGEALSIEQGAVATRLAGVINGFSALLLATLIG